VLFRSALKINELIIASKIKAVLKKADITDFIYINSFNFHYPNIAQLIRPALTIYQCLDPMVVPYDMKHGIVSEQMLVKESDVVICTSKALYKEKKHQNLNTYFVPNAADVEHFTTACRDEVPIHKKIEDLPGPIIGYLGSVERRMDYDLLAEVVKDNADKTFVFAGPVRDSYATSLFNLPNVHFTGPVPYAEAPQMVKGFDVTIIPFKKDSVSNTIFPLKLFEYLGAGKPVVLTDFNPDLKDYTAETVWYCSTAHEFNGAITQALQRQTDVQIKSRMAIAQQNTWEKRAEDIGNIIEEHLNKSAANTSLTGKP
jgi:teichuronic acid biosynthesis glycosyltransferase TuaH